MQTHQLKYTAYRPDGIFGEFTFQGDTEPFMVTLTHAYLLNGDWVPIVTAGSTYHAVRGHHFLDNPKNPAYPIPIETFELVEIPGHTGILFPHWGNFNRDSEGCTLCGEAIIEYDAQHDEMITKSREVFASFMKRLEGVDEFMLEVIDENGNAAQAV